MVDGAPVALLIAYSVLLVYLVVQVGTLVRQGHAVFHYSVVFHALASLWIALRAAWWLLDVAGVQLDDLTADLIFWTPHAVMFLTFATLGLFLLKLVRRKRWTGHLRVRWIRVFASAAAVDVLATVALALLDAHFGSVGDGGSQDTVQTAEAAMNATLFAALATVFVYLGRSLLALDEWDAAAQFLLTPRRASLVAWALAGVFATRCVFNAASAGGLVDVDTSRGDPATQVEEVGLYVLWEFFPLALLLATIATGRAGAVPAAGAAAASFGVFGAIREMEEGGGGGGGGGADGFVRGGASVAGGGGGGGGKTGAGDGGAALLPATASAASGGNVFASPSPAAGNGPVAWPPGSIERGGGTARRLFSPQQAPGGGGASGGGGGAYRDADGYADAPGDGIAPVRLGAAALGGFGGFGGGSGGGALGGGALGFAPAPLAPASRPYYGSRPPGGLGLIGGGGGASYAALLSGGGAGAGGFAPLTEVEEGDDDDEALSSSRPSEAERVPMATAGLAAAAAGPLHQHAPLFPGAPRGAGAVRTTAGGRGGGDNGDSPGATGHAGFLVAQQQAARRSANVPPVARPAS